MVTEEDKKLIKETTEDILKKMGFDVKIIVSDAILSDNNQNNLTVEIESPDSKFIIGKKGATLMALQHIIKLLVRAKSEKIVNFVIDVNGYRQQHENYIKELANEIAQEVIINGRAATLEPMNGYERRLVHLELEKNSDVKTESIGEGENRKVVVSPAINTISE